MVTQAEVLTNNGQQNAAATVRAANELGLPVHIAAAVIQKESNGRNVFGNDVGGAMRGAGDVTPAKYAQFRRMIAQGHTSNGVGPAQITWPGFFTQADREGIDLTDPYQNIRFGLRLIQQYLGGDYSPASIRRAGGAYNGNASYGVDLAIKAAIWNERLAGAAVGHDGFLDSLTQQQQDAIHSALVSGV